MRWMVSVCVLLMVYSVHSQDNIKTGLLLDANTSEPIPQAHIRNLTQSSLAISSFEGLFNLPMRKGDSLWITTVGYQSLGLIIAEEWAHEDFLTIRMVTDTIFLEDLIISQLPSEAIFKQRVLKFQPSDSSLIIHGVEKSATYDNPLLQDNYVKSLGFALSHPFSFAYRGLSKKEKEKRKMYQIEKSRLKRFEIQQKFNRNYVHQLTGLKGDDLINFMFYCDFSEEFLVSASQYQIAEEIKVRLLEFKKEWRG